MLQPYIICVVYIQDSISCQCRSLLVGYQWVKDPSQRTLVIDRPVQYKSLVQVTTSKSLVSYRPQLKDLSHGQTYCLIYKQSTKIAWSNRLGLERVLLIALGLQYIWYINELSFVTVIRHSPTYKSLGSYQVALECGLYRILMN